MIKRVYVVLNIIILLLLYGCSSKSHEKSITDESESKIIQEESQNSIMQEEKDLYLIKDDEYQIYYEKFTVNNEDTNTDVLIEYPQVRNMKSQEIEKNVNKLLKEKAISVYGTGDIEGLNLPMETKVEFYNSSIISVKYSGYAYYYGAANGNEIMYATNINMNTGEVIDMRSLFTESFEQKLNRKVFCYNGIDKASEGEAINPDSLENGYVHGDESVIMEMFSNYYSSMAIENYYFSENGLNIIAKAPSGPTIYFELVASYNDLEDCMDNKESFWNQILK